MNNAIKLAIEKGGYGGIWWAFANVPEWEDYNIKKDWREIVLDPLFWQALGKALGWEVSEYRQWADSNPDPMWLRYAMRYFALMLTGGNLEKFWEELLKEKQ